MISIIEGREEIDEKIKILYSLIQELPARQKEVMRLKFQSNLSYKEIAEAVGISISNVGFVVHSALKKLREGMKEKFKKVEKIKYMIDQDDPKLTTYALNEDVGDKMSPKEKELSDNSEFNEFVRQVTDETVLIRKSFNLEPDIGLTDEQKNNIYKKTGLLAVTQREDDLPTKLLSFDPKGTSQNVKNGKRHIKKTIITSLVTAAAAIILVMVLLHQKDLKPHEMSKRSLENDGLFSITMVENDKKVNKNKGQWFSRQIRSNPVEFSRSLRYQEVNLGLSVTENTITFDGYEFKNPAILTNRLSVFPANIGSKSYDELRLGILAGSLPSSDKINVGELINAFDYNYTEPSEDDLFAVDSEIIISPWSKAKLLASSWIECC